MFPQFKSPLHYACSNDDLRPAMCCVYFTKGYAYATNAHVVVRQSLKWMDFSDEQIKTLEGKFLTANAFAEVYKAKWIFEITGQGIECISKKGVRYIIKFDDPGAKYPDVEEVLSQQLGKEMTGAAKFGFSKSVLNTIFKAAYFDSTGNAYWRLNNANSAAILRAQDTTLDEQLIMVMPILVNEND